jgi:hypothetical protein
MFDKLTAIWTPNSFNIRHFSLDNFSPWVQIVWGLLRDGTPRTSVVVSPSDLNCGSIECGKGSPVGGSENGVNIGPGTSARAGMVHLPSGRVISLLARAPIRAYSGFFHVSNHSTVSSTGCDVANRPTCPLSFCLVSETRW